MAQPSPSTAQQPTPTSPPSQQYPTYPLPIPFEKQAKALQLYKQYKLEKTLSQQPQSATSNHHGFHLNIPAPAPPRSTTSVGSSRHHRALSISTSAYDAVTDLSSVVSFDDNESPTSRGRPDELMSFDGKKIKQRRRSKLNPTKRAKAALVRWLGSCWVCRSRRVPCPLEHHDIKSLEELWQASEGQRAPRKTSSSGSDTSQGTTTFTAPKQENASNASQSDALVGIGADLLEDLGKFDTTLDIQSPADEEQRARIPAPATINFVAPNLHVLDPSPYSSYQNGQMVAIGVYRNGLFYCQHLGGLCQEYFDDAEMLQIHFEFFHFAFTRIDPAVRYICSTSNCLVMNENPTGPCYNCGTHNSIEPWIYGHYIKVPSFQRHAPDGQPVQGYDAFQPPWSYSFSSPNSQWDSDVNGNYTDFNAPGNFTFNNNNAYGGSPYDYNASQDSDNGGGQSPANMFGGTRYLSLDTHTTPLVLSAKVEQKCQRQLYLALGLCLVVFATIGLTHDWILPKARTVFLPATIAMNSHLPLVGFFGIVASFATSFSAKHLAGQRSQSRTQFPFEAIAHSKVPTYFRQSNPLTYVHVGDWS
ncbi:uncharacterized protein LY89DRAFT_741014 [Mollisia scopiformis]|uniref:Uncharacterized protein n=1 Tax=Mollisia scopiformis TaxID=149040 RepID=A0A132BA61_MOLSC|nr:uncharacterized protein LY89DRAFT_741014 [Mollisia scopiformis]KUJ09288.1 hypothetical protein LY89DRAFT_741014 [Mollisia scopiformis]